MDVEVARAAAQGVLEETVQAAGSLELEVAQGRNAGPGGLGAFALGLLLFDVILLDGEELIEMVPRQIALVDEDFAEPDLAPLARLPLRGLDELLAGDELVVKGDPPEEKVVCAGGHPCEGIEGDAARQCL